jgi:hypothetical protein
MIRKSLVERRISEGALMRILYGKSYSVAQGQLLLRSMTKSLFAWEDREDTEVPWIKQEQVEAYE